MAMVSVTEPPGGRPTLRPLGLGFRPFFLLAGLGGFLLIAAWLGVWGGWLPAPAAMTALDWHRHEMLFGYSTAVFAGFLLTATRNWTGRMTLHGTPLAMLAGLWLAARILPWLPGIPVSLTVLADMAFLPLLALALAPALLTSRSPANKLLVALLLAMAAANGLVHAERLGWIQGATPDGNLLMLYLVVWLMIFMGGRVIPFFIEKAVAGSSPVHRPWLEWVLPTLMAVWLVGWAFDLHGPPAAGLALLLALANGLRLAGWHHPGLWRNPMLWVLGCGYAWLAVGFALLAAHEAGWLDRSPALHALTVGGIGVLTLGMMARVALGHTGRAMVPAALTVAAFWLINAAALVRVAGPLLLPARYGDWIGLSALLWLLALAAFAWVYTPVLLRARVDGRAD